MGRRHLKIVDNQSCFQFHRSNSLECKKKSCRNWVDFPENMNCSVIAASNGRMTLQEVGEVFGLTRMRICQIEKRALQKIKKALELYLSS